MRPINALAVGSTVSAGFHRRADKPIEPSSRSHVLLLYAYRLVGTYVNNNRVFIPSEMQACICIDGDYGSLSYTI